MGEIKSTLDLVMERTRHLSLSAEEKAEQQREDFEKRLQGLLQRYADGALDTDTLKDRIEALQSETGISDRKLVRGAVLNRIDPDGDNRCWLEFLVRLVPAAGQPLKKMLTVYGESKLTLVRESAARLGDRLDRQRGIRGSAVAPNPEKDPAYREQLDSLRKQTQSRIRALAD
jgi:hypothetical protein